MSSFSRTRLRGNILANVLQSIASAALLFALYRYINFTLGVEQLGVWSVVLATVSVSRLVDLGLGAGVVRFVARDCAQGEFERARRVVDTAALTLLIVAGVLFSFLYPLLVKLLPHLFQTLSLQQALALLPYALVSLWLTIVAAVFQGGLDGCQRMGLRARLVVAGQSLLLVLALWLVPQHGLIGLAWAQIVQSLFILIAGRLMLCRTLPGLSRLPRHWDKALLREMMGYGANIQAATIFMMLCDPVTKILMARFGGAAAAGYFEMANQAVLKTRSLIVAANQAIVPHVATMTNDTELAVLYRQNVRAIIFVSLPMFSLLIASGGGLSWILSGAYLSEFDILLGILVVGWTINVLSAPAYFCNMGIGRVGWNTLSHATVGCLNVVLGWLLGSSHGMYGVAIGYAVAVAIGSCLLVVVFRRHNGLDGRGVFDREHILLVLTCLVVASYGLYAPRHALIGEPIVLAIMLISFPVIGIAVWLHPLRRQLASQLASRR